MENKYQIENITDEELEKVIAIDSFFDEYYARKCHEEQRRSIEENSGCLGLER